jgi:hypothetical protein
MKVTIYRRSPVAQLAEALKVEFVAGFSILLPV